MPTETKRYVSKALHFTFNVRNARFELVKGEDGFAKERQVEAELVCEFDNLMLRSPHPAYDRAIATRAFFPQSGWRDAGQSPGHTKLGAVPSIHPQPMFNSGNGQLQGMTDAYDPTLHFGVFDLGWIPDLKRRKEAESALDAHGLRGIEYVEVLAEALVAPWPTYDEMRKGAGADKAVAAFVKAGGINPFVVIQYESAMDDTKPAILARLNELVDAQAEELADEASLERVL